MKVNNVSAGGYTYGKGNNSQSVSFKAIHPARYYMKCADGQYRQVTEAKYIKLLQGKVITILNKARNDAKNIAQGKTVKVKKNESEHSKALKASLVDFFKSSDADYKKCPVAQSAYLSTDAQVRPYILTGSTVDLIDSGKSIGKVHQNINYARAFMRKYYGLTAEQAKNYISAEDARSLKQAKSDFHDQTKTVVQQLMAEPTVDKSTVNFYFEPVFKKKAKTLDGFNLVNAVFQRFMF